MKFSHFEKENGERSNRAFLPMYQVLGDEFEDYFLDIEINSDGELVIQLKEEEFLHIAEFELRSIALECQEDVKNYIKKFNIKEIIEEQYEFYNFNSSPDAFDDLYLVAHDGQASKLGAIIFSEDNVANIAKTAAIILGEVGLQIAFPKFNNAQIELPIDLSQEVVNNVRDITINPGKIGSPRDGGLQIAEDMEFNIDGDIFQSFVNGGILYNKTLNCMWRWENSLLTKINESVPVKQMALEIDLKNQDLLDNLGL